MKLFVIASLMLTSLVSEPALAAGQSDQYSSARQDAGAFAGARLRIRLGGNKAGHVRAGLAFAPMTRTETVGGRAHVRYGEGVEFGFNGTSRAGFSVGGQPIERFALLPGTGVDKRGTKGLSTAGAVGIGAAVVVLAGVAAFVVLSNRCTECDQ